MVKNYLKVALRSFYKNRSYAVINIFGLSVAISSCLLVAFFVRSEFSYDRFHSKSDRLYRAWLVAKQPGKDDFVSTITCLPLAFALKANVPEISKTCRVYKFSTLTTYQGQSFNESVHLVDTTFFDLFDFKLVQGSQSAPWRNKNSVIISQSVAKKYFQNEDPYGKSIEIQMGEQHLLFSVSGVVKDAPEESSIKVDFLLPFSNDTKLFNDRMRSSAWAALTETYVLLKRSTPKQSGVSRKIAKMMPAFLGGQSETGAYNIFLQPISSIHLDTHLPQGNEPIGDPKYSYIVSTAAAVLLVTACLNFIILSMARSSVKTMEVGVRKAMGAGKREIQIQFFVEAAMLTIFSIALALAITITLVRPFGRLIGKDLSINLDFSFWLCCLLITAVISVFIAIYPSIVFSRFKVSEILNGRQMPGGQTGFLGKALVISQFTISILFTIATFIIVQQLQFLGTRDLGYQKTNLVIVSTNMEPSDGIRVATLYRNSLRSSPFVEAATIGMYSINQGPWPEMGFTDVNTKASRSFQYNSVDAKFIPALGIKLVAGRNFQSDNDHSILVNETLVRQYGWKNPIGKMLPGPFLQQIEGVVRDFNIESLHTAVRPLVLSTDFESVASKAETVLFSSAMKPRLAIRLRPGYLPEQINELRERWKLFSPGQRFDFVTLDESLSNMYKEDNRTGAILNSATMLSLFISCIGLFGLVTLQIAHRTREIAIRKVLGASVTGIVKLISREFIVAILIASALSIPIGLLIMNRWLTSFAYRIEIKSPVFILSIGLVLLVSFITTLIQTFRAGMANPTESIR
jgi:putative ABC transport system permease protein